MGRGLGAHKWCQTNIIDGSVVNRLSNVEGVWRGFDLCRVRAEYLPVMNILLDGSERASLNDDDVSGDFKTISAAAAVECRKDNC